MTDEIHTMPIERLRERVRDAEGVLRSARNYLRDVAEAPALAEEGPTLAEKLGGYFDEINRLLPGFGRGMPAVEDPEEEELKEKLAMATVAARGEGGGDANAAEHEHEHEHGHEDEDEDEEDDEEDWEIDLPKFKEALANETLMATLPEGTREVFRQLGLKLVDRLERRELIGRVVDGMGEIVEMLEEQSSELGRVLAQALTFERLRTMQRS
jgi:hypothetical protein